ncbi:hypothetical protein [Xanthomonas sacchari]|uniref:hypothetical protein n=1 Tax=Xanthomonas sacchari TaxID=56458 RepID=UPI00225E6E7C|nr:hypothetical protein [Xanthomonas sacchari]
MHESANAAVPAARRWLGLAGIACLAVLAACACSTAMQQRPLLPDGTHAAADAQDANAARAVIVYFDRSGDVEQTKRRISAAAAGWHAPLLYTLDRVGAIVLGGPDREDRRAPHRRRRRHRGRADGGTRWPTATAAGRVVAPFVGAVASGPMPGAPAPAGERAGWPGRVRARRCGRLPQARRWRFPESATTGVMAMPATAEAAATTRLLQERFS